MKRYIKKHRLWKPRRLNRKQKQRAWVERLCRKSFVDGARHMGLCGDWSEPANLMFPFRIRPHCSHVLPILTPDMIPDGLFSLPETPVCIPTFDVWARLPENKRWFPKLPITFSLLPVSPAMAAHIKLSAKVEEEILKLGLLTRHVFIEPISSADEERNKP